jgi:hypothetical protein
MNIASSRLHPGTINEAMYQTEMESKNETGYVYDQLVQKQAYINFRVQNEQIDSRKSRMITKRGINETRI